MISKKNILMIAATPFFSDRGCHIRIYNEIKYLLKNNISVDLCTYNLGKNPPGIDICNIKRSINIPWYRKTTPGASWHKIYLDFFLLLTSIKHWAHTKNRIIHAHLYEALCIAIIIKIISFGKSKIIFDCQGSLAEEMYQYTLSKNKFMRLFYYFFIVIEKFLLLFPDYIFCSSTNSRDLLLKRYKIDINKIDVLNDGIDFDLFLNFDRVKEKKDLKHKLNIADEQNIILYTGSLSRAKGVDKYLEALEGISINNPGYIFVFAGYGELEEVYKIKYHQMIIEKKLFFLGGFDYFSLPKILSIADIFIEPKNNSSESSGKIYNYLFFGLPIICFKNKLTSKLLDDNGVFIDNYQEFVKLDNIKSNIYSINIPEELSWQKIISKCITLYEKY
ncbi:MAG: glycosyltransferase family 4 protein [Patescibacteria group bacterium]